DLEVRLPFGNAGLTALAGAKHLGGLRSLRMEFGPVTRDGFEALAWSWFRQLRALRIRVQHDRYGSQDSLLDALASLGPFPRLAVVAVGWQRFSAHILRWFLPRDDDAGFDFPQLRSLDLAGCKAERGENWADALAECRWPLRELNLYQAALGPGLADALAA